MSTRLATHFGKNAVQLRSEYPLAEHQIRSVAPSIFAEEAHSSRSARYTYIPTIEVLRALQREGFQPFMVGQSRTRDESRREYTKHMLRMRRVTEVVGAEANEVILVNSHDGASKYQLIAGCFRFVCLNGMVCGDIAEEIRVRHSGNVVRDVIDGAFRVVDNFAKVEESVDGMKSIRLEMEEQRLLARSATLLRFGSDDQGEPASPVDVSALLTIRRPEDRGNSLWTTFQRIQENAITGGLEGRSANGRRLTTRPVAGIDRNVSLNRALWSLAEGMRALKEGRELVTA